MITAYLKREIVSVRVCACVINCSFGTSELDGIITSIYNIQ